MGVQVRQKDGKWYVFINHQGKRKAKCVGRDKRVAVQIQKQLEAKLALGDVGLFKEETEAVLFRDYAEQYLETYATRALKPSSKRTVRNILTNHLLPAFGARPLQEITRQDVKVFMAQKPTLSTTHVRNILRHLSAICNHAVEDEVIAVNPASKMGKYLPTSSADPDRHMMPFTSEELTRYLAAMQERYPQYYAYFFMLARTGMREGEGLALTWDAIQFGVSAADPHRFIHVQRTYDPVHNRMNTPKSGKRRRVDMSRDLRAVLCEWREQCFEQAVLAGKTEVWPVVFATATGRPWDPQRLFPVHKRVCALAGLRANRVHDLRHSFATIHLYDLGTPVQYVSEQLGHSSIKITVDIYGHPRQGTNISPADRLDTSAQQSATQTQLDRLLVV
jgi:integrase